MNLFHKYRKSRITKQGETLTSLYKELQTLRIEILEIDQSTKLGRARFKSKLDLIRAIDKKIKEHDKEVSVYFKNSQRGGYVSPLDINNYES